MCLVLKSLDRTLQKFIIIIVKINKDKLKEKIKAGHSTRTVAMQLGCSPTTVRRKAAEMGLKFNNKSNWSNHDHNSTN